MNLAEIVFVGAGGFFIALLITIWYGPYVGRIIAAALLTHAATTEKARRIRRKEFDRQMRMCRANSGDGLHSGATTREARAGSRWPQGVEAGLLEAGE